MDVVEQEINAGMQWTAIAVTHVEYHKGFPIHYRLDARRANAII